MKQGFLAVGNMNVRMCDNNAIFVQYNEGGKSKEVAFAGWPEFLVWLELSVREGAK